MTIPEFVLNPDPEIFWKKGWVTLDFETTNLDFGDPINEDNRIVLGVVREDFDEEVFYTFDGNDGEDIERLLNSIDKATGIIAHNAKFECGWLKRCGADLSKLLVFDTQIAEYVLEGKSPKGFLTLDSCLKRRGLSPKISLVSALIKAGVCPSQIPKKWLQSYCKEDVRGAYELFLDQRQKLWDTGQHKVFYTKCLQAPVLADIEFNGMQLDYERVKEEYDRYSKEYAEVEGRLAEITGGINPNSPKQMAEFLYDTLGFDEPKDQRGNPIRTATGGRSASKEIIGLLRPTNATQKTFIELKTRQGDLNAKLSKYLTKFMECCEKDNGKLYASFNQTVSHTGRYTSTGKNYATQFQNLFRDFKRLFTSGDGDYIIGEADERQLEFRTAVYFGQDNQGFKDIEDGTDVHAFTANIIGCSRQDAKAHTFKPLYGGVSGTTRERAYYDAFKAKYPQITSRQDAWVEEALNTRELVLDTGQRWKFPDLKITRSGYVQGNTKVRNYPVQYLATAEIVPIALVYAWHDLKARNALTTILNTIHDSIICKIHRKEIELFREIMVYSLSTFPIEYMKKLYGIDFNVKLESELKVGEFWGEGEEI